LAFVERSLGEPEREVIERHLQDCEGCRKTIGHVVAIGETGTSDRPSPLALTAREGPGRKRDRSEPARGDAIGRFLLLELLGVGGMGMVFAAHDPELDRKVAIKLLRAGVVRADAGEAHVRLLREAQAMAKINHPNVIKVHDVGTHGDEVYLAMELADAGTVRAWLAGHPSLREIVDVFVQAGRGLAAAHTAGLIHRDFKPDNVLRFEDGRVCVTDFGLVSVEHAGGAGAEPGDAIASEGSPLARDLTRTGSIMGTPLYMSPEQFGGRVATASTDQFSFCVALYEALYGVHPFAGTTYEELATNVAIAQVAPAPNVGKVPGWLRRMLLRGLAFAPEDRFPSMTALVDELARDRTIRRRRIAGGAVIALGIAGAGIAYAMWPTAEVPCQGGEARVAKVWSAARRREIEVAFLASKRPHAAATFAKLEPIVDDWGRSWALGHRDACEATRVRGEQSEHVLDLRMRCLADRLDEAGATLALLAVGGGDAVDQALDAVRRLPSIEPCANSSALDAVVRPPETDDARARVQAVNARLDEARAEQRLGRYARARDGANAATVTARATGYAPLVAEALLVLGKAQLALADRSAIDSLREASYQARAAGDSSTEIEASAALVDALTTLRSKYELALEVSERADAAAANARPPAELLVELANARGVLDLARGNLPEARTRDEQALAVAEPVLGPDHVAVLTTLEQLGNVLRAQGSFADARKRFERVLATRERIDGPNHPEVATAIDDLGNESRSEGKLDDAKRLYDQALAIRIASFGPDHPAVAGSYNNLGTFYAEQGDLASARKYFDLAIASYEKIFGPNSVELARTVTNLGSALVALGQLDAAKAALERARSLYEIAIGPDDLHVAYVISELGVIAEREDKLDDALAMIRRAEQIAIKVQGPGHPDVGDYLSRESSVLDSQDKLADAEATATRALEVYENGYGPDHPRVAMALAAVARLQGRRNAYADALANWQRSLAIFEARFSKDHPSLSYPLAGIGDSLTGLHRGAEAVPYLDRALQIRVDAKMPVGLIAEIHYDLGAALVQSPATRARGVAEGRTALALYEQANDAANARELRTWLAAQH